MTTRIIVLAAIMLAAVGPARAENRDVEAKEHYEEGTKAFNLGEFKRAVEEYRKAYNAKPEPVLLYDIAQSYRLANDLPNALFFYRSFLHTQPNAPNRREIADRIHKLETQIQQQQQVTSQPPNVPVPIGGQPPKESAHEPAAPSTSPPVAPPSAPSPSVSPSPSTQPTPAPSPAPSPAPAAAEPAPASPALQLTQSSPPPGDKKPVYKKWWLWTIVGGVVVVGVGVGVGVALSSGGSAPSTHLGTTGVF